MFLRCRPIPLVHAVTLAIVGCGSGLDAQPDATPDAYTNHDAAAAEDATAVHDAASPMDATMPDATTETPPPEPISCPHRALNRQIEPNRWGEHRVRVPGLGNSHFYCANLEQNARRISFWVESLSPCLQVAVHVTEPGGAIKEGEAVAWGSTRTDERNVVAGSYLVEVTGHEAVSCSTANEYNVIWQLWP